MLSPPPPDCANVLIGGHIVRFIKKTSIVVDIHFEINRWPKAFFGANISLKHHAGHFVAASGPVLFLRRSQNAASTLAKTYRNERRERRKTFPLSFGANTVGGVPWG